MKKQKLLKVYWSILLTGLTLIMPFLLSQRASVFAQSGNTVSGYIFGFQRQPLEDINIELLDDLSRTIQRARSNSSGYYIFSGIGSGHYKVRVLPFGTDYEEQEIDLEEFVNFSRNNGSGGTRLSGFSGQQQDFYLKFRKGVDSSTASTIFVQEVPGNAKKLYESAIENLEKKKEKEAFEELKSALEIFPKYYAALEKLGTEYVRRGYFEASQILLAIAVDVNPRGYKSWYGLAYSLYSLQKYNEAAAAVQKAIDLNGSAPDPMLLSGVLMKQGKRFDEAEKRLLKAKELCNDTLPQVHWELALLYGNNMKRYADAAKELRLFLKAQPDSKDTEKIKNLIKVFEDKAKTSTDS